MKKATWNTYKVVRNINGNNHYQIRQSLGGWWEKRIVVAGKTEKVPVAIISVTQGELLYDEAVKYHGVK